MLRVVIRNGFSNDLADLLFSDLQRHVRVLAAHPRSHVPMAPPDKRQRIQENFHRYGFLIFAVGRLVPGIRTTLFLTAGTMRLSLLR